MARIVLSVILLIVTLPLSVVVGVFCLCAADPNVLNKNHWLEKIVLSVGGAFVVLMTLGMSLINYYFTKLLR